MTGKEAQTISYYDHNAEVFTNSSINANMTPTCDEFLGYLQPNSHILDLGCGTGRDSRYFIAHGHSALPVDGSAEMCRIATEVSGVAAKQMLFQELNFTEEFDGVWACASLLHAERNQLPTILQKISVALKDGGILYMSFKYGTGDKERSGRFFSDMTEDDIPFLCDGYKVIRTFITEDVRADHKDERWLNIFVKK